MRKYSRLLLFGALTLILLSSACAPSGITQTPGAATGSPSAETPTTPTESETPTATPTSETPTPTPTSETPTPTPTPTSGTPVVPLDQLCTFCVQKVPHAIVAIPENATFEVTDSASEVVCAAVEVIEGKQLVLCHGPKLSTLTFFELNVCSSDQNCTKHQVPLPDCSLEGTATPDATHMATATVEATSDETSPTDTPQQATPSATDELSRPTLTPTPE